MRIQPQKDNCKEETGAARWNSFELCRKMPTLQQRRAGLYIICGGKEAIHCKVV